MEKTKLKKIKPPFAWMEFSPYEFGITIATFAINLQDMLKGAKKSQRYRIELTAFKVLRVRGKNES